MIGGWCMAVRCGDVAVGVARDVCNAELIVATGSIRICAVDLGHASSGARAWIGACPVAALGGAGVRNKQPPPSSSLSKGPSTHHQPFGEQSLAAILVGSLWMSGTLQVVLADKPDKAAIWFEAQTFFSAFFWWFPLGPEVFDTGMHAVLHSRVDLPDSAKPVSRMPRPRRRRDCRCAGMQGPPV